MQQFLKVFLDIVLWRRGPQDLPSSWFLVGATLVFYLLVSVLQLSLMRETAAAWFVFLVVDPLLLMAWVWLVLRLYNRSERYRQTIAAVLGTSSLLALVLSVPLQLLTGVDSARPATPSAQYLALGLVIVFVLVCGRIIRAATDSNLFTGIAVSLTYVIMLNAIAGRIVGSGG